MSALSLAQTQYYLGRLLLFRSVKAIADGCGVTRATVDRWARYEVLPSDRYRKDLQRMLHRLAADLKESVCPELGVVILYDPPPLGKDDDAMKAHQVRSWLAKRLRSTSRPVLYSVLMDEAIEKGITRSQLQYAAVRLKVTKIFVKADHKNKKPAYSLWRLK